MSNYVCNPEQHEGKGYVLWTPWQWTAPLTGEYKIYLSTHGSVYYDNFVHGFFDNIKVSSGQLPNAYYVDIFDVKFGSSHVNNGDCFHPSTAGHELMADEAWCRSFRSIGDPLCTPYQMVHV